MAMKVLPSHLASIDTSSSLHQLACLNHSWCWCASHDCDLYLSGKEEKEASFMQEPGEIV